MNHSKLSRHMPLLTLLVAVLPGCATEPSATQKEFGSSVRHMISTQTYEPGDEVTGLDGEKSRGILQSYREDTAKPGEVEKPVMSITLD